MYITIIVGFIVSPQRYCFIQCIRTSVSMAPVRDDFWTDPPQRCATHAPIQDPEHAEATGSDFGASKGPSEIRRIMAWLSQRRCKRDLKRVGYRTVEELTGSVETFFKDPGEWMSSSFERCTEIDDMILRPTSYTVPFQMLPYIHLVSDAMPKSSHSWAVRCASTKRNAAVVL